MNGRRRVNGLVRCGLIGAAASGAAFVALAVSATASAQTIATSPGSGDSASSGTAALFVIVALGAGTVGVVGLVRRSKPFRLDPTGMTTLEASGRTYNVYTYTGRVIDSTKWNETVISGSTSVSPNGDGVASTNITSHTIVHDQFFLEDAQFQQRSFKVDNVELALAQGQKASVVWAIAAGDNRGPFIVVRNHTTGETTPIHSTLLVLARRPRHVALALWVSWLSLLALPGAFAIAMFGMIPALILSARIPRRRVKQFELAGVTPLLSALDERASAMPAVVPDRTTGPADDLVKLAELAQQGLLTQNEWSRAKELYLGKAGDARAAAVAHLRQLHALFKDGVLSESEFNTKKWEILAGESTATS